MLSRYVVVMGTCLLPVLFGCTSDDSNSNSSGSAGSAGSSSTSSTTSAGGTSGSGGSAAATTGGGTAGSTGSGGSGGGSSDGGGCNSACDCPTGQGCFDNKCSPDLFAYCCSSDACKQFSDAICQRSDKTWTTCGSFADGGKDNIDYCPYFGCASGQACPSGCKCGTNDLCVKQ